MAFSPDGKRIVSGSDDKMVRLWEIDSKEMTSERLLQTLCKRLQHHSAMMQSKDVAREARQTCERYAWKK